MKEKNIKSSMKYMIVASLEVDGRVEEHDIIGAIFGQTEGLLGEDFNLEKLQEKDKIGRLIVDIKRQGTKTVGRIYIPSNLDRVETAILAAMLETVDRIGPFDARIKVEEIRDLREEKIKRIIERAKELVQLVKAQEPDVKEIIRQVAGPEQIAKPRKIKVIEYGPDKLPASPGIEKSDTIIIVEGRADVINLMKYGYDNVIAIGGAKEKIPKTIIDLANKKKTIALVDGDRGGEIILKTLLSQANIDYVARAPKGMEVEHLTGREIAEALAKMRPAEEVKRELGLLPAEEKPERKEEEKPPAEEKPAEKPPEEKPAAEAKGEEKTVMEQELPKHVEEDIKKLRGTLEAIFYDRDWKPIKRTKVRDLYEEIKNLEPGSVMAVVFDGIITQRIINATREKGIKIIIGARKSSKIDISKKSEDQKILEFADIKA